MSKLVNVTDNLRQGTIYGKLWAPISKESVVTLA